MKSSEERLWRGKISASGLRLVLKAAIVDLIQQHQATRQRRNFAAADDIRDQLAAVGIRVIDQTDGAVRWHRQ
ncbi:MAG: hypothetical protein AAFY20_20770 [Cyanobacteria bacterium J06639_14]